MILSGAPTTGPFRGALPFDEAGGGVFFGRTDEVAALFAQVTQPAVRISALTGPSGVGKTSLLRAGLLPALANQGIVGLYLDDYDDLGRGLTSAASRMRAEAPATGESAVDYVMRLARTSDLGVVLVLDRLEDLVGERADEKVANGVAEFIRRILTAGGATLRVLLSIDAAAFARLSGLLPAGALSTAGATLVLEGFDEEHAAAVIEQTALQTGTFIEAGLAGLMAGDLCRTGRCLPIDLQIVARTMMELRLTSIRRYERGGGVALLGMAFFERNVREAGGRAGLKVLLSVLDAGALSLDEMSARTQLPRAAVEHATSTFFSRGVFGRIEAERGDRYDLLHPALAPRVAEFCSVERARAQRTRRLLARRRLANGRLSLLELFLARRDLHGALSADEQKLVQRSVRRKLLHTSLAGLVAIAVFLMMFIDLRSSYTIGYQPNLAAPAAGREGAGRARARVVVRMGRPGRQVLSLLPHRPAFGSVLADTGFSADGLSGDLAARIDSGRATGKLERLRSPAIPGWLRTVLSGVRPVQRGTAAILLGEPSGIGALSQGFADPRSRRETLDVLEVVGRGSAGEDELLAAALADPAPEIRKRGVAVAAAIDRRQGNGAHAGTLRTALSDTAAAVRLAVLNECATLPATEAADILRVALASQEPDVQTQAERAIVALAERAPEDAARAAGFAASSEDALRRKSGLSVLHAIAEQHPKATVSILATLVADAKVHEDTRVQALHLLRQADVTAGELETAVAQAVAAESSPRLRAAALPLRARTLDPVAAEELAISESRGPTLSRAAAVAIWGTLTTARPEAAAKALRIGLFDPAAEVRVEAARGLGFLRRDGLTLVQRALFDPNGEVQKAAMESAVRLGAVNAYAVADALSKALRIVRPGMRPAIVEALGHVGAKNPQVVLAPLVRAFKEGNRETREKVALTLCLLLGKQPQVVSPYLRLAARDTDRTVRAAAAACLTPLAAGDPRGAGKLAEELAAADEPSVRVATAEALGNMVTQAKEAVLPPLALLLADAEIDVRLAALRALSRYGEAGLGLGKHREVAERAINQLLSHGDREKRLVAVQCAASNHLAGLLRLASNDGDEGIRLAALRGAAAATPPDIELLRSATDAASATVRTEAIKLLVTASGAAASSVLPVFESMLRLPGASARHAAIDALGQLAGVEDGASALLGGLVSHRSERTRAAAVSAFGAIAARAPALARPWLEKALTDPAHDVQEAAGRGLSIAWSVEQSPAALASILEASEADSRRRFVALDALVRKAKQPGARDAVLHELTRVADGGPPLARLAAQIGRVFADAPPETLAAFLDRLLGA